MAAAAKTSAPSLFDLKSASLTVLVLVLRHADLGTIATELQRRFGDTPEMFAHDPVVLDLAALAEADAVVDFAALTGVLKGHRLLPVGVRNGSPAQMEAALAAGLGEAPDAGLIAAARPEAAVPPPATPPVEAAPAPAPVVVPAPPVAASPVTLVIDKPLRSGQQVYAKGGDLIVLAAVNFGAEVIADGNIHVYAPLRGKAIAGAKGNREARIFSTCLEPELVAIAGTYRTTENPLPAEVLGQPAQIRLDGERLVFEPLTSDKAQQRTA